MSEKKRRKKLSATEERFLNYVIDNDIKEILPVVQPDGVVYTIVSGFDLSEKESIEDLLFDLTDKGFFDEQEYDRSIFCPNCGSIHVYSKLNCPRCNSRKVNRHELIEHAHCGYIGGVDDLKRTSRGYLCPNCGESLRNKQIEMARRKSDYLVIGSSYSCDNCGHKFDKPNTSHHCQKCGNMFNFKQASYEKLYQYTLTSKIEEIVPSRAIRDILRSIESQLLEKEFQVELQAEITGQSGQVRNFEMVAEKNNRKMVLAISSWGKQEDLLNLLGKKMDVEANSTVLIDLSGNNSLEELGKVYDIKVFNGKSPELNELMSNYIDPIFAVRQESRGFFSRPRTKKDE